MTVASAAGAWAAAMPPPPLPGAGAWAAPVSWCGARAPPSAVTRTGPDEHNKTTHRSQYVLSWIRRVWWIQFYVDSWQLSYLLCSLLRDLVLWIEDKNQKFKNSKKYISLKTNKQKKMNQGFETSALTSSSSSPLSPSLLVSLSAPGSFSPACRPPFSDHMKRVSN